MKAQDDFKKRMIAALQKTTNSKQYFVVVKEGKGRLVGGDFPIKELIQDIIDSYFYIYAESQFMNYDEDSPEYKKAERRVRRRKKAFFDALLQNEFSKFAIDLNVYIQTGKIF